MGTGRLCHGCAGFSEALIKASFKATQSGHNRRITEGTGFAGAASLAGKTALVDEGAHAYI